MITKMTSEYFSTLFSLSTNFEKYYQIGQLNKIEVSKGLVIVGMGGSAIAGDYITALANRYSAKHVNVYRGYTPPKFFDKDYSVVVISYSGNTEETITSLQHFIEQGNNITTISSGGLCEELSHNHSLHHIKIEEGLAPRDAFYHVFGLLFGLLHNTLTIPFDNPDELTNIAEQLKNNTKVYDTILPQIIGKQIMMVASELFYCSIYRWRSQLNENSKLHAAIFLSPEFSHNAIIGYDGKYLDNIALVIVKDEFIDHPRTQIHLEFKNRLIANGSRNYFREFQPTSTSYLGKLIELTSIFDYISIKAALDQGIDPATIDSINQLKSILRSTPK